MWVVHIMFNNPYSLEHYEKCTCQKKMRVISKILVKITNSFVFQRAITLLLFIQLLPKLACSFQLSWASIFILYHIFKYVQIRRYKFIVINNGGHLGFLKIRSGYEMSTCQNIEALGIRNKIQQSNCVNISVYTGLYCRSCINTKGIIMNSSEVYTFANSMLGLGLKKFKGFGFCF